MKQQIGAEIFWPRVSKVVLAFILGLWALFVVYGNVADYGTNWVYVQDVMSMTASQNDPNVAWRAISDPSVQRIAYAAIILGEAVAGVLFVFAASLMLGRLRQSSSKFQAAKAPFAIGLIVALLVWLFGFMVIAGEWFQMWRSSAHNAQQTAFLFYMTILVSGLYVFQREDGHLQQDQTRRLD